MSWKLMEKRIAYFTGGKLTSASGAGYRKGDVWVGKEWMLECKTTTRARYRLSVQTLDKLAHQSDTAGLSAALIIVYYRSYEQVEIVALCLHRRGEFRPDWRSRAWNSSDLLNQEEIISCKGIWHPMSFESFLNLINGGQE